MSWRRRITRSYPAQKAGGWVLASYLRLVRITNRKIIEPADAYDRLAPELPMIIAMWHGQHYMVPFLRRGHKVKVLISRHRDGEINATAAELLGLVPIRGSGDHDRRYDRKGGVRAFMEMLDALGAGYNVALTADVPKKSRIAGEGIVTLARLSGRPIFPVAVATSRRRVLDNWDRSAINMPFGRMAMVVGNPIRVTGNADAAMQEAARQAVEAGLNAATARAYEIADRSR
jgi:lysophospholipid acyltransferase (LPLAT)-like uncharacterized protein